MYLFAPKRLSLPEFQDFLNQLKIVYDASHKYEAILTQHGLLPKQKNASILEPDDANKINEIIDPLIESNTGHNDDYETSRKLKSFLGEIEHKYQPFTDDSTIWYLGSTGIRQIAALFNQCHKLQKTKTFYLLYNWLQKLIHLRQNAILIKLCQTGMNLTDLSVSSNHISHLHSFGVESVTYVAAETNLATLILIDIVLTQLINPIFDAAIIRAINTNANPNIRLTKSSSRGTMDFPLWEIVIDTLKIDYLNRHFQHQFQAIYYVLLVALMLEANNPDLIRQITELEQNHKNQLRNFLFKILVNRDLKNFSLTQKTHLLTLADTLGFDIRKAEFLIYLHEADNTHDDVCRFFLRQFYLWSVDGLVNLTINSFSTTKQKLLLEANFARYTSLAENHQACLAIINALLSGTDNNEKKLARKIALDLLVNSSVSAELIDRVRIIVADIPKTDLVNYAKGIEVRLFRANTAGIASRRELVATEQAATTTATITTTTTTTTAYASAATGSIAVSRKR